MTVSQDTIFYIFAFVIPGFVATRVYSAFVTTPAQSDKSVLLASITASALLYAFVVPVAYWAHSTAVAAQHPRAFMFGALVVVLAAWPVLAAVLAALATRSGRGRRLLTKLGVRSPLASAWDHFFTQREACFVLVTFDDGSRLGGSWEGNSFASSQPVGRDLYIAVQWRIDPSTGAFRESLPLSRGAWVDMNRVRHIEFFNHEYEEEEREQGEDHPSRVAG